jgi:hypothetical protein
MKQATYLRPNKQNELTLEMEELRERAKITLQQRVTNSMLSLFALNTVCVLTIIFLRGFGSLDLSDGLIHMLIAETVAQAGAIFFTVVRRIF